MAQNLVEEYKGRLAVAESVYKKAHEGAGMDNTKKMAIARVLKNTDAFLTEAFEASSGTQRSNLGDFKKFCLNLTNVALPNLIANDLVIVSPMSSMTGYVAYIKYEAGINKGETAQGDVLNDPFRLGKVDSKYTSSAIVENTKATAGQTAFVLGFEAELVGEAGAKTLKNGKVIDTTASPAVELAYTAATADGVTTVTLTSGATVDHNIKIAYFYNNEIVPQAKLPTVVARMDNIPLLAKARRIAVYYSQIAAFQAKQDYGFDLGDQLAEKAVGQLSYEIDTEIVELIDATADTNDDASAVEAALTWSKTLPVGVSKMEHYAGFAEIFEIGKQIVYDRTKRFAPNYMLIASNVLPVLTFVPGFQAAPAGAINGPYLAGTLNGVKIFVSPAMAAGRFVLGVNGDDMMSSVAVYAPYMAIVPTQLLQFADGGSTQGWSTMYDLKVLNKELCVAGKITA